MDNRLNAGDTQRKWSNEFFTPQGVTLALSLVAQVVTLVFSSIAVNSVREDADRIEDCDAPKVPPILALVMILELIVQVIELIWYLWLLWMVGGLSGTQSVSVSARYFDWALSTPIMLINVYFFMWFSKDRCMQEEDLVAEQRYWWLVLIVAADWLMLLVGFARENAEAEQQGLGLKYSRWCYGANSIRNPAYGSLGSEKQYEIGKTGLSGFFNSLDEMMIGWSCANNSDGSNRCFHIISGFLFLGCAFIPHIYLAIDQDLDFELGVLALVLTLVVWALYGVVFAVFHTDAAARNSCYNVLDIVSKNLTGILVSIIIYDEVKKPTCPFPR